MYSLTERAAGAGQKNWQGFRSPVETASARKYEQLYAAQPSITMLCGICERNRFIQEEMYICFHCKSVVCRKCLSEEVDFYFCPQCQQTVSQYDAENFRNRCSRCYECPNCLNVVNMMLNNHKSYYYYLCQSCHWSSADVGMVDPEIKELVVRANNSGQTAEMKQMKDWFVKKCESMRNVETQREKEENRRDAMQRHRKTLKFLFKDKIIRHDTQAFSGQKFTFQDMKAKQAAKEQRKINRLRLDPINYRAIEQRAKQAEDEKDPQSHDSMMDLSFSQLALDVDESFEAESPYLEASEQGKDSKTESEAKKSLQLINEDMDYLNKLDKDYAPPELPVSLQQELSEGFSLDKISTLEQRLNHAEGQSRVKSTLAMQHLPLRTIRSKRCGQCMKFIVKPNQPKHTHGSGDKYEPFQMASVVVNWLPKVRIYKFFQYSPTSIVAHVRLTNCLKSAIKVKFMESATPSPESYGIPNLPKGDFTVDLYDTTREVTGRDQLSGAEGGEGEGDLIKREGNSVVLKFAAVRDEAHATKAFKIRCVMVTEFVRLEPEVNTAELEIDFGTFQLKQK